MSLYEILNRNNSVNNNASVYLIKTTYKVISFFFFYTPINIFCLKQSISKKKKSNSIEGNCFSNL